MEATSVWSHPLRERYHGGPACTSALLSNTTLSKNKSYRLQAHRIKRRIKKAEFKEQEIVAPTFIRDDLVDAEKAKLQHERLLQWRDYDLIALLFALIGFMIATVDVSSCEAV